MENIKIKNKKQSLILGLIILVALAITCYFGLPPLLDTLTISPKLKFGLYFGIMLVIGACFVLFVWRIIVSPIVVELKDDSIINNALPKVTLPFNEIATIRVDKIPVLGDQLTIIGKSGVTTKIYLNALNVNQEELVAEIKSRAGI